MVSERRTTHNQIGGVNIVLDISELSCTGKDGRPIYGTAAILHRIFQKEDESSREEELAECKRLAKELGYLRE